MLRVGVRVSFALFTSLAALACAREPAAVTPGPAPEAAVTPAATRATPGPAPEEAREMRGPTPPIPPAAMVEQLLAQHVLDHPQVRPYLHTEVAGNLPLRVAPSADLAQGAAKLRAGGQGVVVVAADAARVVFRGRERIGPAQERLRFEIPAEGVAGHVDLELADNVWRAVDAVVRER